MNDDHTVGEIASVKICLDGENGKLYVRFRGYSQDERILASDIHQLIESLKSSRKVWDRNEAKV